MCTSPTLNIDWLLPLAWTLGLFPLPVSSSLLVWVVVACRLDVGVSVVLCIIYLPLILISVDLSSANYYHDIPSHNVSLYVVSNILFMCGRYANLRINLNLTHTFLKFFFPRQKYSFTLWSDGAARHSTSCACLLLSTHWRSHTPCVLFSYALPSRRNARATPYGQWR